VTVASPTDASTTVLVLNHNGRQHLDACFGSLGAMDVFVPGRPGTPCTGEPRHEVWLVDNGSCDGSVDHVRSRFPWVKALALDDNLGFSRGYDAAAEACDTEWVAFLNNDTRVDPGWLSELHACRRRHPEAVAVASRIMSWDGERIDFVGADTFFFGHALQRDVGASASGRTFDEPPLLFGCAGALLVNRRAFLDLHGFDPDYFSFNEDVDLGWRANVLGRPFLFAPNAVSFHKLHGTWSRQPSVRSRALIERNVLGTVLKNWDDARMGPLLMAAAGLTLLRAWAWTSELAAIDRPFLTSDGVAHLVALAEFGRLTPRLLERRAAIQPRRVRSDDEIAPLLGAFASPPMPACPEYRRLFAALCSSAGLREGEPLPAWPLEAADDLARRARELAEGIGRLVGGWQPAERFSVDAPEPDWEFPLPVATHDALRRRVDAVRVLLESGLHPGATPRFADVESPVAGGPGTVPPRNRRMTPAGEGDPAPGPAVSVVVRTKDRPAELRRALASVAAQTRPPRQVVIVNDGGGEIGDVVDETLPDLSVTVVEFAAGVGRSRAAQAGLEAATGDLVCFLDDDDELDADHLEALVATLRRTGGRVAHADVRCMTEGSTGEPTLLAGPLDPWRLPFENTMPIMSVLFDRALAVEAGGFDAAMEYFEDWDLWLRLARLTTFEHCPRVTSTYHVRAAESGMAGRHRWPPLAHIFTRHRDAIGGADWARFYARHVESLRVTLRAVRDESEARGRQLRALQDLLGEREAHLSTIERSAYWKAYQWLRRLTGRR
jgi:GT2 family glycosyltransferase